MELMKIEYDFSICKVTDFSQVDWENEYCFAGRTDEECSLVCISDQKPANTTVCDDGWRGFRIQGVLDFSLVGILSRIAALLAENGIGIFAVSTYNTDYIFTKKDSFPKALEVLSDAGYGIV